MRVNAIKEEFIFFNLARLQLESQSTERSMQMNVQWKLYRMTVSLLPEL